MWKCVHRHQVDVAMASVGQHPYRHWLCCDHLRAKTQYYRPFTFFNSAILAFNVSITSWRDCSSVGWPSRASSSTSFFVGLFALVNFLEEILTDWLASFLEASFCLVRENFVEGIFFFDAGIFFFEVENLLDWIFATTFSLCSRRCVWNPQELMTHPRNRGVESTMLITVGVLFNATSVENSISNGYLYHTSGIRGYRYGSTRINSEKWLPGLKLHRNCFAARSVNQPSFVSSLHLPA